MCREKRNKKNFANTLPIRGNPANTTAVDVFYSNCLPYGVAIYMQLGSLFIGIKLNFPILTDRPTEEKPSWYI
jgi:hypothetical protein